jgi:hypothetical protein
MLSFFPEREISFAHAASRLLERKENPLRIDVENRAVIRLDLFDEWF